MNCVTFPFSTINSISISVNNSNLTSVFFKSACHANARAERNIHLDFLF